MLNCNVVFKSLIKKFLVQTWLDFWVFIFWVSLLSFLVNPSNFINLIIFSEISWLVLYCYSILTSLITDDLNLLTLGFFILGFAGVEFSLGFLLIFLFKKINKKVNFIDLAPKNTDRKHYSSKWGAINNWNFNAKNSSFWGI